MSIRVSGCCPVCGTRNLALSLRPTTRGYIICQNQECSRPTAVHEILSDSEIHHVVDIREETETFSLKHPLRERLDDALLDCRIFEDLKTVVMPSGGRWRIVENDNGGWSFES